MGRCEPTQHCKWNFPFRCHMRHSSNYTWKQYMSQEICSCSFQISAPLPPTPLNVGFLDQKYSSRTARQVLFISIIQAAFPSSWSTRQLTAINNIWKANCQWGEHRSATPRSVFLLKTSGGILAQAERLVWDNPSYSLIPSWANFQRIWEAAVEDKIRAMCRALFMVPVLAST